MEVKEAIECLEVASEFQVSINRQEEIKRVISLLKSLESENKKLKKENKAYRGMWEALWDVLELCTIYDSKRKGIQTYAEVILPELEQKYLGGGE